ncbi:MAG: competence/damage-inducible protein A [Endomicrobiaceae bacterium]|nr:competence/damage-inducible protein A [Endomicrobiaceae bacterium]
MKIELICTGSELLTGKLNTNASFIGQKLSLLGLDLSLITTVSDRKSEFTETLKLAKERSSVIIITGGLGPTFDDITVETVAKVLELKTYKDENVVKSICQFFEKRGLKPSQNNERQSYIIQNSKVLENRFGTAPGQMLHFEYLKQDGKKIRKTIFLLPGPPREMQPMFEENLLPFFKSYQTVMKKALILHVCGMPESLVDEKIQPILEMYRENKDVEFAILAHQYIITVKAFIKGEDEMLIDETITNIKCEFVNILGENIFGYDNDTVESVVQKLLIENKKTISIAESCTGGLITSKLISIPGSSICIKEGVITYSNESKISLLGVKKETIDKFGAVSEQVASEMLDGILNLSKSDFAVSITGIAGPSGTTDNKPVGLVYIGSGGCGDYEISKYIFTGTRNDIRERASNVALDLIRKKLLNLKNKTKSKKGK